MSQGGVHYTPINLVDLVLDPVFEGLEPGARVLDPACGSGVFLVESLRRLVWLRARHSPLTRTLIRQTLLQQVRGVDISPAALSSRHSVSISLCSNWILIPSRNRRVELPQIRTANG
ncbi:N-6 DNA methylase [Ochrobactrum pseudogrignonense]|nr:N-6 DNA methylase [Brucella pseudogrignonensis]